MFIFLIVLLAATNLIFFGGADSALTLFWPVFAITLVIMPMRMRNLMRIEPVVVIPFFIMVGLMALSAILNIFYAKPTSIAFSAGFLLYGFWMLSYKVCTKSEKLNRALTWVLITYLASTLLGVLLLQAGGQNSWLEIFGQFSYDSNSGANRLQGLSSEPSYAAFIVAAAWLGLSRLRVIQGSARRASKAWIIAILLMFLGFGSVYAVLLAVLVLAHSVGDIRSKGLRLFIIIVVFLLILMYFYFHVNGRTFQVILAIFSFDTENWQNIDGSSYMRFGPTFHFLKSMELFNLHTWIGHGAATSTKFFAIFLKDILFSGNAEMALQLGFIPAFLYDYGLLPFLVFLLFSWYICRGPYSRQARGVVFLMLLNANINTQLFWFVLTCIYLSGPPVRRKLRVSILGSEMSGPSQVPSATRA